MKKLNNKGWGMMIFLIFILVFMIILFITTIRVTSIKQTINNEIQEEEK